MTNEEKESLETMLKNIEENIESLLTLESESQESFDEWDCKAKGNSAYPYRFGYVCSGIKSYAERIAKSVTVFHEKTKTKY